MCRGDSLSKGGRAKDDQTQSKARTEVFKEGSAKKTEQTGMWLNQRYLRRGLDNFVQSVPEFLEPRGRDDDAIAAATNVFSDAEKSPPGVFFQNEDKCLALDMDSLRP